MRRQPNSMNLAPQRAFSLKQTYVNKMWSASSDAERLIKKLSDWSDDLSFEEVILRRFEPFKGMYSDDIEKLLGIKLNNKAKGYHADLARRMMGVKGKKIEEFENANVDMKTMRLRKDGVPKEDMVFKSFDYMRLVETDWEGSEIYQHLNRRFFFPIFRIDEGRTYFEKAMFWSISENDLLEVKKVWEETVRRVKAGRNDLPRSSENPVSHIRPHARNSNDRAPTPCGTMEVKKAFWLNKKFIANQIAMYIKKI